MTVSLVLLVAMAVLYACGVYLLLEKSMTRVLLGVLLLGNATNLLILLISGEPGLAPIMTDGVEESEIADPLPQALVLTAIVITFAVSAFLLALIYRSWRLAAEDDLEVDEEDVAIGTRDTNVDEPDLEELATATDFDPVDEDEEQRQARSST
ncbi:Na(+)/H(+) antiporter subunit C [Desertivibrio insolitus]|uniref:Na(+)/H(+) antiporter subunit C n=1 Tax=Herbiconiux sp. SYSU D00978 TaxID=2812562 RepID=UPI001A95DD0E|nr:Na(+)/H(+) antiporter subunit C [Herbiconiux sp. SYSU D00978]